MYRIEGVDQTQLVSQMLKWAAVGYVPLRGEGAMIVY
jgi:hypothetical protein